MNVSRFRRYSVFFSVSLQDAFQARTQSMIWFFYGLVNAGAMLLFWNAGAAANSISSNINISTILLYYILMLVLNTVLMSHIEESMAVDDIKEGGLVKYLLRPVSYFWYKFITELPWRISGGMFALSAFVLLLLVFHLRLPSISPVHLGLFFLMAALTIVLSFTYKMVLSLIAFWTTEGWALFEIAELIFVISTGFVIPLSLLPSWLHSLVFLLPFPYMLYMPTQVLLGQLSSPEIVRAIVMQLVWIAILGLLFHFGWKRGLHRFTGVGQ